MKTYNEMAASALRRIEEHKAESRNRKKYMKQTAIPIVSLCLAAAVGAGVWQSGLFTDKLTPPTEHHAVSDVSVSSINTDASDKTESTDEYRGVVGIHVNTIEGTAAAAKRYLDPDSHYQETWNTERCAEYFGRDLSALTFSSADSGWKYVGSKEAVFTFSNDGTVADDWSYFHYKRGENQTLTISASRICYPFDCLYELSSETKTVFKVSTGGKYVVLGGIPMDQQTADRGVTDGYKTIYEFCVADFEWNGVFYRIQTKNVTGKEFYGIIRLLLSYK